MSSDTIPDPDELCRIAVHERRRAVLATLRDASNGIRIEELAARIATAEADDDEFVPRDSVQVELVHLHLPLLRRAGLIDYDHDRRVVEPRERLERVVDVLPEELLDV